MCLLRTWCLHLAVFLVQKMPQHTEKSAVIVECMNVFGGTLTEFLFDLDVQLGANKIIIFDAQSHEFACNKMVPSRMPTKQRSAKPAKMRSR